MQKLDFTFNIIYDRWRIVDVELQTNMGELKQRDAENNIDIMNEVEYYAIIDRLKDDGYIKEVDYGYNITSKGEAFWDKRGSYKINAIENERTKRANAYKDYLLIGGSLLAGVGTICLATVELLKHFCWQNAH